MGRKEIDLKEGKKRIEHKLPRIAPPPSRRVIAFT